MQAATQTARTNPLRLIIILLLVFSSGFANLATEVIGPRMFSSFFGSSTLVWAVMISVTLVGLSVGYYISGQFGLARAKRWPPWFLVGNALILLVISWRHGKYLRRLEIWALSRLLSWRCWRFSSHPRCSA